MNRVYLKALLITCHGIALIGLSACDDQRQEQRVLRGSTMGTTFSVKLIAPPDSLRPRELQAEIESELASIEQAMSTYLKDSELSRFNNSRSTDVVEVSAVLCESVAAALDLSRLTGGAFDITVGPLVNAWGFGPAGAVAKPPAPQDIERLKRNLGFSQLSADCSIPAIRKAKPELYLDLSAYAKGYAVDQIANILDTRNLPDYVIEVGGELRMRGRNANRELWAIAIERPQQHGQESQPVQTVIRLTDLAVATSGDYRNYFEHDGVRYSHTIDPLSGAPVSHSVASVTVIAESAAYADAMATALLVMGPVEGMAFAESKNVAAYFLMHAEDSVVESMSRRFAEEAFNQNTEDKP